MEEDTKSRNTLDDDSADNEKPVQEDADSSTGLKELVGVMVRALVDETDQIDIREIKGAQSSCMEVRVAKSDLGKIIGKRGTNVMAIRTILGASSAKFKKRIILDIIE
jgi:predicted RNA-binding protein YlqC (UPF0109 family)